MDALDSILKGQSEQLFKLDEKAKNILYFVAKNGPSSIYDIRTKIKPTLYSATIYQQLFGSKVPLKHREGTPLTKNDFLKLVKIGPSEKAGEKVKKKLYGLTLKGAFTALSGVEFESIYIFKELIDDIRDRCGKAFPMIVEVLSTYFKAEIGTWFQAFLDNGLILTNLRYTEGFYYATRWIERIFEGAFLEMFKEKKTYSDERRKLTRIRCLAGAVIAKSKSDLLIFREVFNWPWLYESVYEARKIYKNHPKPVEEWVIDFGEESPSFHLDGTVFSQQLEFDELSVLEDAEKSLILLRQELASMKKCGTNNFMSRNYGQILPFSK